MDRIKGMHRGRDRAISRVDGVGLEGTSRAVGATEVGMAVSGVEGGRTVGLLCHVMYMLAV